MLIACDGSSLKNGTEGTPIGWAWARDDGAWMQAGKSGGTNNRAELHAILSVLAMHPRGNLTVLMDSQYALNIVEKWAFGWERKGWRKSDGKAIQNLDLVKLITYFRHKRKDPIEFQWVKAHQKDSPELNVKADELAYSGMSNAKDNDTIGLLHYLDSKNRTFSKIEEKIFEKLYKNEIKSE